MTVGPVRHRAREIAAFRRLSRGLRMRMARRIERALARNGLPPQLDAHLALWSIVATVHDQPHPPTDRLIDLALEACKRARTIDLSSVADRVVPHERFWVSQWPGEHYRLLAALMDVLRPDLAVEIGTFTGMGALALRSHQPTGGRVITYDIVPWRTFPDTLLREDDLKDGVEQRVGDLSDPAYFEAQRETLRSAQIIFIDGPKDGRFEPAFLRMLVPALRGSGALLVLDDIRLLNMVRSWRELPLPKLDLTSFGHWSGTGLAEAR